MRMSAQRRPSVASLNSTSRPTSPDGSQKSLRSFSSCSSILSIDGLPSLPLVVSVRKCVLRKRYPDAVGPGWGFVLRGTTSEFPERTKVYTCHIESVHDDGTAKVGMRPQWGRGCSYVCLQRKLMITLILESLHGKPLICLFRSPHQARCPYWGSCSSDAFVLSTSVASIPIIIIPSHRYWTMTVRLACSHTPSMKGAGLGNSFKEL